MMAAPVALSLETLSCALGAFLSHFLPCVHLYTTFRAFRLYHCVCHTHFAGVTLLLDVWFLVPCVFTNPIPYLFVSRDRPRCCRLTRSVVCHTPRAEFVFPVKLHRSTLALDSTTRNHSNVGYRARSVFTSCHTSLRLPLVL